MKRNHWLILALLPLLILSGCSLTMPPQQPPVSEVQPDPTPPVAPPADDPTPPAEPDPDPQAVPAFYTVRTGDTLSSIAEQFALPAAFIAANNGLGRSNTVKIGQQLRMEPRDPDLQIKVDLTEQVVQVYAGEELLKEMACSSGAAGSVTPTGVFYVQNRGDWFFSSRYQQGGEWWVSFRDWGVYLFHSVPMDESKQIIPEEAEKLGQPASHGCVRLAVEDAKWIYDHVPAGTKIVIQ